MRTIIDGSQLSREAQAAKTLAATVKAQAVAALKSASFAVEMRVKQTMPVDTGRARASWGHWTPGDIHAAVKISHVRGRFAHQAAAARGIPSQGDAVWDEADNGLTITQGSNLPYIEALNNGHSRQAPAGFLDTAQLTGQVELEKALGLIDPLDQNLQWLTFGA